MSIFRRAVLLALLVLALAKVAAAGKTENVIMITIDGMRWQEIFTGADSALLNGYFGGVENLKMTKERFWRDTPEARRETMTWWECDSFRRRRSRNQRRF